MFAPFGLGIFDSIFAYGGRTMLRLFALVAVANIAVAVPVGILRAGRQVARLLDLHTLRAGAVFGLSLH